jgi:hypothetical protein
MWPLGQGVKEFRGFGKPRLARADNFGFGGLERFFGGDAIEPALMREFFVVGEIEADQDADFGAGFGGVGLCAGLLFRDCRLLGGFLGRRCVVGFALELQKHFLAEAEALRPAFHFVASLLRYFFVVAEIENQEVMGHGSCIAKFGGGWLGVGGFSAWKMAATRADDGNQGARLLLREGRPRGSLSE